MAGISTRYPDLRGAVFKRAALKRRIAASFDKLESDSSEPGLATTLEVTRKTLSEIESLDEHIINYISESEDFDEQMLNSEMDSQSEYLFITKIRISKYIKSSCEPEKAAQSEFKLKLPELNCESFSGEGDSYLEFHSFIQQFNNVVGFRKNLSDCTKFTYLKS